LLFAVQAGDEGAAAKWLIDHGADVSAVTDDRVTIFSMACGMMTTAFLKLLTHLVPREHFTQEDNFGDTPMKVALCGKKLITLQHLILTGVPT